MLAQQYTNGEWRCMCGRRVSGMQLVCVSCGEHKGTESHVHIYNRWVVTKARWECICGTPESQ